MAEVLQSESYNKHTPNRHEVVTYRRELVARMRVRGLTMREITAELGKRYTNPQTGEPFHLDTIKDDIHALDRQWQERSMETIGKHRAEQFATLQEVIRQGWRDDDMGVVLRALKQWSDLLGLDAPKQVDLNIIKRRAQEVADRLGVPVADVMAQAEKIAQEVLAGSDL